MDLTAKPKRSFIQRYFDRELNKSLVLHQQRVAAIEKELKLYSENASLSSELIESTVTISELRYQRIVLIAIIIYLVVVIWKLIKG